MLSREGISHQRDKPPDHLCPKGLPPCFTSFRSKKKGRKGLFIQDQPMGQKTERKKSSTAPQYERLNPF
jgi:hypothetical protein